MQAPSAGEQEYRRRKEEQAAARKRDRRLTAIAEAVSALEVRLDEIHTAMEAPENAADYQLLMRLQEQSEQAEAEYLSLLEEQEQLQRQ